MSHVTHVNESCHTDSSTERPVGTAAVKDMERHTRVQDVMARHQHARVTARIVEAPASKTEKRLFEPLFCRRMLQQDQDYPMDDDAANWSGEL